MRVRQSDLKTWQRCPLQLKFQKVDGIAREQNAALSFGTILHACVLMMEVSYDLQVGLDAFEKYWTDPELLEPGLTPTEYVKGTSWKKYHTEGPIILRNWWGIIQWESDDVIAREHTFSVPIGDHILDGTVDKLAIRYLAPTDEYALLVSDYKGLALDTPLPTPSGWTSMRDVRVGDQLIGGGGRPCSVIGKSEPHQRDCYRITFDDKTSVVCDNEHLWQVEMGYQEPYDQKVMATEDLAQNLFNPVTGQRHLRIPNVELDLPEADLPIDPYVLGAWLGDGAASCGLICKPLPALFAEIARRGYRVGDDVSGPDRAETRTIFGLRRQLREAGLLNNKHVPAAYLRASRQQRLDLLRGIMDTDGHWNPKRRRCVVNVTDERFANEVRELALSLGYGARTFATTANGFGLAVDAWQTWFTPSDEAFIARCPEGFRADAPAKAKRRLIHSIERIPTVTTQCVMVDSPDQTYLCGDQMVVTHNTNRKEPSYGYLYHDLQFSAYCLDPETPVLMADLTWKPIGEVEVGEYVLSADEYPVDTEAGAKRRHWRSAEVQNAWTVEKESYRIVLSDGREITAGGTHRFLAQKSGRWEWRTVEDMQRVLHDSRRKQTGIRIASVIERPDVEVDYQGQDYCAGYLAGATLGDGAIRSDEDTLPFWQIGVGAQDQAFLDRVRACAVSFGIKLHPWHREPDGRGWQRRPMVGLQTRSRPDVEALAAMNEGLSLDWKAGWLAGLYDADGGLARSSLTYYQKDVEVLKQVQRFAQELGFTFTISTKTARLEGDRSQVAAFCGLIRPALERKVELLRDSTMRVFDDVRIMAIEALGPKTLVDITTSTGTFVADGVVSHNCYATTQREFWTGIQDGEEIWEKLKGARRVGEWVQLTGPRRKDAGERTEMHYARLRYAINAFAESVSLGIFVPNISGDTCMYCDFRKSCGLLPREDEERLMLV